MTDAYLLSVQKFIHHFQEQGKTIGAVTSELHKKILYALALDALARAVYEKEGNHRSRLVNLLVEHTKWSDANRISLFQLSLYLRDNERTGFPLYQEVERRLDASAPQERKLLNDSPQRDQLTPYPTSKEEQKVLENHSYAHLFYNYRNNLVHEFRAPGYGIDWSDCDTEPFYTSLSSFGERELVFPVLFFASLYAQALTGVESFLITHGVNPHNRFTYGSYWHPK